jgi:hypothetical protein
VGTLRGATPLPWHALPRLCSEPNVGADRWESIKAGGCERITKGLSSLHGNQPVIDVSLE